MQKCLLHRGCCLFRKGGGKGRKESGLQEGTSEGCLPLFFFSLFEFSDAENKNKRLNETEEGRRENQTCPWGSGMDVGGGGGLSHGIQFLLME